MTRKFLRRIVELVDWSGLEIRLVYYPPYHSKYNPIERCWSSLQHKWNGVLLTCWEVVRACALRMIWRGEHPQVHHLEHDYAEEVGRDGRGNEKDRRKDLTLEGIPQIRYHHHANSHSRQVNSFMPIALNGPMHVVTQRLS